MSSEQFDRTYYEDGIAARVSGYKNYRWLPHYSLPFANEIKRRFYWEPSETSPHSGILDYGCAKGFLVKALRLLNVKAFGYDISRYAIEHADPTVRDFVSSEMRVYDGELFGVITAKDTLEHVPLCDLNHVLRNIGNKLAYRGTVVVTVPLGDDGEYRIREYELDKTHVIREDEEWWIESFRAAGLFCDSFYYDFPGAKDHWLKVHPHGNGTFILRKQGQW